MRNPRREHAQRHDLIPILDVILTKRDGIDLALKSVGVKAMFKGKRRSGRRTVSVIRILPRSRVKCDEFGQDGNELKDDQGIE